MNKISFKNRSSQRIYADYLGRVEKSAKSLSKTDKDDLLMEINSHIYEGTARSTVDNEIEVLLDVIAKLGSPEEFMRPLVAGKKLDEAVHSFRPGDVFQAIRLNLRYGISYTIFGLLYLFLFSFIIIVLAKIISPDHTGLFYSGGSFNAFGYVGETAGLSEVLGYWIIPISFGTAFLLYICITLFLRVLRR